MTCSLCLNFPGRQLAALNDDLENGSFSIVELAEKYYVPVALLEEHKNSCIGILPSVGHELLEDLLREVRRAAEERKTQYESDPDANNSAMTHYVNLMREARELVLAMDKIRPSEELTQDIINQVLAPLIREIIYINSDEAKRLREELQHIVSPDNYRAMDRAVKSMLDRFAGRFRSQTDELIARLKKLLAATSKSRKSPADNQAKIIPPAEVH